MERRELCPLGPRAALCQPTSSFLNAWHCFSSLHKRPPRYSELACWGRWPFYSNQDSNQGAELALNRLLNFHPQIASHQTAWLRKLWSEMTLLAQTRLRISAWFSYWTQFGLCTISRTGFNLELSEQVKPFSSILAERENTNMKETFLGGKRMGKKISSRLFTVKSNTEYFPINMHAILARHRPQQIYTHCFQELSPHLRVEGKGKSQHYPCKGVKQLSTEVADCSLTFQLHECAAQMRLCCTNARRN